MCESNFEEGAFLFDGEQLCCLLELLQDAYLGQSGITAEVFSDGSFSLQVDDGRPLEEWQLRLQGKVEGQFPPDPPGSQPDTDELGSDAYWGPA